MSQQKSYKRNKDERFSITMGILLIALTAIGAWLIPPMPAEGGLIGIFVLAYGIFGPSLRRRSDRNHRLSARIARQKARENVYW
ncbi:hypothetical protein HGB13_01610 [bacterium]|nr:hypothetical protein [bacterium]